MRIHRVVLAMAVLIVMQLVIFTILLVGERRHRRLEAANLAQKMAAISYSSTEDFFNRYLSIFDALKTVEAIIDQNPEPANGILNRLNGKYREIVNFAAVRKDGSFFASGKPLPQGKSPNIKEVEFFKRILAGEQHVIMQPHPGPISQELVTGVVVPLEDSENQINGLIGVSIQYQALINRWEELFPDTKVMLAVHDKEAKQIHRSKGLALEQSTGWTPVSGTLQRISLGNDDFVLHTLSYPDSGWRFSVFVRVEDNLMKIIGSRRELIFLLGLILVTICTLGIWFAHEIQWSRRLTAEQVKLQQSEATFRQLAENINAVFWISPPDKKSVIYVSPGFEKIWGKSCQVLYENPWVWVEAIHPEESARIRDAAMEKQSLGIYDETYRIIREDGAVRWVHDRAFPILGPNGEIHRIVGIAEDVTERVLSEDSIRRNKEELRAILDNSVDAIGVSQKGIHSFVNASYLRMFGYQHADELIGSPILDLIAPSERDRIARYVTARSQGQEVNQNYETKGLKKDGSEFDMEVNVALYGAKEDRKTLVILRDVTDRNLLEEKLRQSQKMEAIGNLAGGIAHDFNNILAPVMGMAELLLEDLPKDSPAWENVQEILTAGKRGSALVKRILAFSRRSDHQCLPMKVQDVLREVIKLSRSSIPADIDIKTQIQKDCGMVEADPTQIHQVAMNLITNAYHAVETSGGEICVMLEEKDCDAGDLKETALSPGPYVILTIADTGIGIDPSDIKKIFEPYFSTKEKDKGTGLGLSVVFGIVKKYNGDICVESTQGKGSVFKIFLPKTFKGTEYLPNHMALDLPKGTEKILLVDDEKPIAKVESQILSRFGYLVTEMTDSSEALRLFKSNPEGFDLVITDMTMPHLTGGQLAREILTVRPDIPIIVCTGFSERMSKEQAEKIGVKGFLMKPISKADIAVTVRAVLDQAGT